MNRSSSTNIHCVRKICGGDETNTGSANVAIADASVPLWSFVGYGLQEADMMKWVPFGTLSDDACGSGSLNAQKWLKNR